MPRGKKRNRITLAAAFELLVDHAVAALRCPKAGELGLETTLTSELARSGKIRVHVYPQNYRVVEIADGPHAGKATAPPPNPKWKPYLTIEKDTPPVEQVRRGMPGRKKIAP
jgi:hypothetical protein